MGTTAGVAKGGPRAKLGLAMMVLLPTLMTLAPGASAAVKPFEVEAYREALDVPGAVAEAYLEVQAKGGKADIAGGLEEELGESFAGIWFDPESGEYVVPVASGSAGAAIGKEMRSAGLGDDYRSRVVERSWEELEAAQNQLDQKLGEFFEAELVYTSLDPRTNTAVLHVAADAS